MTTQKEGPLPVNTSPGAAATKTLEIRTKKIGRNKTVQCRMSLWKKSESTATATFPPTNANNTSTRLANGAKPRDERGPLEGMGTRFESVVIMMMTMKMADQVALFL